MSQKWILAILAVVFFLGIGIFVSFDARMQDGGMPAYAEITMPDENESVAQSDTSAANPLDLDVLMADRSIGSDDAPVTIIEYASLSCAHCGAFHENTLPLLKKDYVDTGKVKIIFKEFPFNGPALRASQLARCMPAEKYYTFTSVLFKTMKNWAYNNDFLERLIQTAKLGGMDEDAIEACINNEELQKALIEQMQDAQTKWDISSTPSFVINNGAHKLIGNQPYEEFKKVIDPIIAESSN